MISIRNLTSKDIDAVSELDELTNFNVSFFLNDEDESMAFGLFLNDKLIGYASLGYADDCAVQIENHPDRNNDSLLLSDVFITHEFRGNGYSVQLVEETLKQGNKTSENVYLTLLDDGLQKLYEKFGFVDIGNGCMYRSSTDLTKPRTTSKCSFCSAELEWVQDGITLQSSDYVENLDVCKTCLIDHCCKTDCGKCTIRTVEFCEFVDQKTHYLQEES